MAELIEPEVIELLLEHKHFYGHFLQQFRRHHVDASHPVAGNVIRTCAVMISDELQPHLFINKDFYNSGDYDASNPNKHTWGLTQEEKIAILEHEILHILNKHLVRQENRNHYVSNIAQDLAINQYIKGLPHGMMCPDCNIFVRKTPQGQFRTQCPKCGRSLNPKEHVFEPLQIQTFKIDGKKVNLESERPFEIYYDIIWSKMPKYMIEVGSKITNQQEKAARDSMGHGKIDQNGNGQQGNGGSGDEGYKQKEGNGEGGSESPRTGSGITVEVNGVEIPMPLDNHEAWSAGSDNREMAHEKIKEMVKKTVHKVSHKSQGYMPAWLKGLIDECLEHKTITWKSELRRFYGFREFSHYVPTRKRLNRRFPLAFPGYKVKRKAHIVVATDSSGSVSDEEFAKFWAEMYIMFSAGVTITHVEIDADITHVQPFKRKPPKGKGIKRWGYGGTDFRPVFEFVKKGYYKNSNGQEFKLKGKVDAIIYCTDGMGTYPKSIPCPTIWVLTANHSTYGWSPKLGKTIVMSDD